MTVDFCCDTKLLNTDSVTLTIYTSITKLTSEILWFGLRKKGTVLNSTFPFTHTPHPVQPKNDSVTGLQIRGNFIMGLQYQKKGLSFLTFRRSGRSNF